MRTTGLRLSDLLLLATRIFAVKPTRALLTVLGTSIGIATVVFLVSLGYGLQYLLLGRLITTEDSLLSISASFPPEAERTITEEQLSLVRVVPEVKEATGVAELSGELRGRGATGVVVVRLVAPQYFRISGNMPDIGIPHPEGVVLSSQAVQLLSATPQNILGERVELTVYSVVDGALVPTQGAGSFVVTGVISDELEPPLAMVPASAFPLKGMEYKEIYVLAKGADSLEGVRTELLNKGYLISARADLVAQTQKILNIVTIVLGVFGVAALVVSAVGMFNTMIVSFMERIYEVGIMKSLGARNRDIQSLFLIEALLMGLLGGIVGILLGVGGGELVNLGVNILSAKLGGEPLELFLTPLWFLSLVLGISAFIGLFAGFWPARKATLLSPKEAFLRK
jgi:ABC-type antimicrobial peptide transport system permease subunit